MFTKEQLAQIIKEETAAVLAEQEVNEGPFDTLKGGISKVGGDIKKYAGDVVKAGKTASVNADIKKQIDVLLKQNAATLAALQKLDARAQQLGVSDEQLKAAIQHSQQLASALGAEAAAVEEVEPLGGAPAGGSEAGGEPSPKA